MSVERTNHSHGFTLAELLVTLAIIGILFAIALPAFNSISAQSKLDGAAHSVLGALKLAHQHAKTHQQPAYLLIQDDISSADPETAFRSYAVFTIDTHNQPITADSGQFLLNWQTLPHGIVFDNRSTGDAFEVFQDSNMDWNGAFNHNRQLRIGSISYIAIGFKPNGNRTRSLDCEINLAEGLYDGAQFIQQGRVGLSIQLDDSGASRIKETVH